MLLRSAMPTAGFISAPAGVAGAKLQQRENPRVAARASSFAPGNLRAPSASRQPLAHVLRACAARDETSKEERDSKMEKMRLRLEGLFGSSEEDVNDGLAEDFDGAALRRIIKDRYGVQYDVQPQKRHGRVYVQVMWRYFEQQSFYMQEDEFANHCEAVAQLLQEWGAVDYFCDYIASIKKRRTLLRATECFTDGVWPVYELTYSTLVHSKMDDFACRSCRWYYC